MPTSNELRRIYRAIYRFQAFCSLYRHPQLQPSETVLASFSSLISFSLDDYADFLSRFHPWQVEEIVCIRDFIHETLGEICEEVQQEISFDPPHVLKAESGKRIPDHLPSGFLVCGENWMALGVVNQDRSICLSSNCKGEHMSLSSSQLLMPSADFYQQRIREAFMAKGISYMNRLLTARDRKETTEIFFEGLISCDPNGLCFLSDGLDLTPFELLHIEDSREAFFHEDEEVFESEERGPNAGWAWANGNKKQIFYNRRQTQDLRSGGYVFWDRARLVDLGVLDLDNSKYLWGPQKIDGKWQLHEDLPLYHEQHCLRIRKDKECNQGTNSTLQGSAFGVGGYPGHSILLEDEATIVGEDFTNDDCLVGSNEGTVVGDQAERDKQPTSVQMKALAVDEIAHRNVE